MYLFNAKIENPEKLEKMLVGRSHIVDILVSAQLSHINSGMPPQYLVIGPRGSGKTHILRIVYDRLSKNTEFMATHEIAYMVEDETGIGSYFDLLQRIFEAIKRWSNDTQKNQYIAEQVEILKDIHPNQWAKSAEQILLSILKDKSLLVLIENFDSILKGIDKKNDVAEIAKLRDFVQQHNQLSFIATSQSLINALSDNQNPLYGFFNIIQLKRLTLDESFEYVKKVALAENNDELVQFLETHDGKGHLEAIHQFTKGNHRLLLVFFDFLKAEFRSNLSDVFLKSIDELKPYYESFIRNLAPQQQKIVQYLCLQRIPQKGTDIGRNCFLDRNTVSKQLSELQLLGYVSAVNEKGRNKYYEINEPLLRMCIEINEDRNGIIKLFVNFLGQLYTAEQLKEKYLHYNFLGRFQPEPIQKLYQSEAKIYEMVRTQFLRDWNLNDEEKNKLDMCCEPEETKKMIEEFAHSDQLKNIDMNQIVDLFKYKKWRELVELIEGLTSQIPPIPELYNLLGLSYEELEQYEKSIKSYQKSIELNPDNDESWFNLGNLYSNVGQYEKSIQAYLSSIKIKSDDWRTWNNLGSSYRNINEYSKSVDSYKKATELNPDSVEIWDNLAELYRDIKQYDEAICVFLRIIELKSDDETVWFRLGFSYLETKQYEQSIKAYLKALEVEQNYSKAWNNLGVAYQKNNQHEESINAFLKVIEINKDDEMAWCNLGSAYSIIKQYPEAVKYFLKAIEIKHDDGISWNNLGLCYYQQNELISAKDAFLKAIEYSINREADNFNDYATNLIEVQFALKETSEALSSIETLFSKPERLEFISKLEDALVLLCKENSEDTVKEVFNKLLQICTANNVTEKLSALLSNVVFRILREYKELKPFRIELLQHILEELFRTLPEFTYPLRYLNIGIRYFLKDEKEAIYEMSQEERVVFEKFTSTDSSE